MSPKNKPLLIYLPLLFASFAWSQPGYQFGQNKVQYKNFDWALLRTEHFEVHYYSEEAEAARNAARMAERGYAYLSEVLEHQIRSRIPLVLYASLNDFQQTNVVDGILDDGTRGVTESLKNRVVLPITGSYREFNHVLVHELVHAFQFDIIAQNSKGASLGRFNPPLWFVEGMAEYLSVGMDNVTRMWVRDGLLNKDLLTVEKLNNAYDIRVYRLGESLWNYIGETQGKKKVGHILKTAVRFNDIERALKAQLNMNLKELTDAWHDFAQRQVLPADSSLVSPNSIAEQITKQESFYHRINIVPSVSPDGKHIAYVANKNLNDEIYLLSEEAPGKFSERRLVKGGQSRNFESLRYFDTSLSWSRDGRHIAFVSKAGKDDAIYVIDPSNGEVVHKLVFEELNGLLSPSFSPDGDQLVFVGIRGGISDLYTITFGDSKPRRLNNDVYAELQPQWSPDGSAIAFVTDRGEGTDEAQLLFGDLDLAIYSFANNAIELYTNLSGNLTSPQWSADASEIAFVSEHRGIPNIYRLNLASREIAEITSIQNGVAGITELTPAMSWSSDGRVMVFSSFVKNNWQLFRMNLDDEQPLLTTHSNGHLGSDLKATKAQAIQEQATEGHAANGKTETKQSTTIMASDALWLPANPDPNQLLTEYALADEDSIEERKYSNVPKFTAASVGASFGGYFGTVGGAQLLFSDILNNHNFIVSANLRRNLKSTDVGLGYLNQSRRLNWGFEVYQLRNAYGVFYAPTAAGFVTQTYRGLNAFAYFPFSRFSRLELGAGATTVSQDFVIESMDFDRGQIVEDSQDLGGVTFAQFYAAWVYDNSTYGLLGPFSGSRARFEVQRAERDYQFTTWVADYRIYFSAGPRSVLAVRTLGGASFGRDAQVFQLGGAYSFRGAEYGDLLGTRFLVQNVEYRFPLLPFLPPQADFLSLATFVDAAAAWGIEVPGLIKETFQPFSTEGGFHLNDLRGAFGIGGRLNLGYFVLKYDVAWPTDLRNIGKPVRLFSIGTDF